MMLYLYAYYGCVSFLDSCEAGSSQTDDLFFSVYELTQVRIIPIDLKVEAQLHVTRSSFKLQALFGVTFLRLWH
jgi:hypothetical protein